MRLVGVRSDEVGVAHTLPITVMLMRSAFDLVEKHPKVYANARITGRLMRRPQIKRGPHLAIAVRGRIGAVVPAVRFDRRSLFFSAILPEGLHARDANEVEIFLVEGRPGFPKLTRVQVSLSK